MSGTTALPTASGAIRVAIISGYRSLQVEYYEPALKQSGGSCDYAFQWQADYAVSGLSSCVREPVDAHNISGAPPLNVAGTSGLGLNYYTNAQTAAPPSGPVTTNIGTRFCRQRGRPAVADDRYGRRCGTPLRSGLSQADPQ